MLNRIKPRHRSYNLDHVTKEIYSNPIRRDKVIDTLQAYKEEIERVGNRLVNGCSRDSARLDIRRIQKNLDTLIELTKAGGIKNIS